VTARSGSSIRSARLALFLNTTARLECYSKQRSFDAEAFRMAPEGARFPWRTTREEEG